jgi:hypothetical protein
MVLGLGSLSCADWAETPKRSPIIAKGRAGFAKFDCLGRPLEAFDDNRGRFLGSLLRGTRQAPYVSA